MLNVLDLFSGIGGFSLGLERAGMKTAAFCEIEPYPCKVLAKHWPDAPIYNDVRTLTKERLDADGIGSVDVICGGFPCQDISTAGNQKGIGEGTRSGLWSECARLLGEIRPKFAIFENVTALISGDSGRWFQRVLWDISQIGYDAEWHCIPASELGAHHHRDRVWIIAYPNNNGSPATKIREGIKERVYCDSRGKIATIKSEGLCTTKSHENVAYPKRKGLQGSKEIENARLERALRKQLIARRFCSFEPLSSIEPILCRGAHGVSNQSHRIKALGNAVVPQIPEIIGRAIIEYEKG